MNKADPKDKTSIRESIMKIGCPKEIKPQEFRVGMTPGAVHVKGNRIYLSAPRGSVGEFHADGTVKSTLNDPKVSVESIFAGSMPFVGVMLLVLLLVALFPWMSLALT